MIRQGEIWWAELPVPSGSEPGFRRPLLVVQGDAFNRSGISTALCVVITSNLALARAPGNVLLGPNSTGLNRDSVANVSQVITVDRSRLSDRAGTIAAGALAEVFQGIDLVLGR